jgi:hypothetical protein
VRSGESTFLCDPTRRLRERSRHTAAARGSPEPRHIFALWPFDRLKQIPPTDAAVLSPRSGGADILNAT